MRAEPHPTKFTLDGKEYDRTQLTAAQNELLQQCQDLAETRRQLDFKVVQVTGALEHFVGQLRKALIDSPPPT